MVAHELALIPGDRYGRITAPQISVANHAWEIQIKGLPMMFPGQAPGFVKERPIFGGQNRVRFRGSWVAAFA